MNDPQKELIRRRIMYIFNEAKVYADYADGQYIVLDHVTGNYYSFDHQSSEVLGALTDGVSPEAVAAYYENRFGNECGAKTGVNAFVEKLLAAGILIPDGEADTGKAFSSDGDDSTQMPELSFETFSDVADLLLMDPIHEVNEEMGWPLKKE